MHSIIHHEPRRSQLMAALLIALLGAAGCHRQEPAAKPAASPSVAAPRSTAETNAPVVAPPAARPADRPAAPQPAVVYLESLRQAVARATAYGPRIEARRAVLQELARRGDEAEVQREEMALLDDVERQEGPAMAARVALAEGSTFAIRHQHGAAAVAYALLRQRYPASGLATEAWQQLAECRLHQHRYAEAEQLWHGLIESRGEAPEAAWAWRRLALAQLLQSHFDEALATLEMMARKYAGTDAGEYARMRQGYVLAAAGRSDEARKRYTAFLAECGNSPYCRLARTQLAELVTIADAAGAKRSR